LIKTITRHHFILLYLLGYSVSFSAQDVEAVLKADPIKINGGISLSSSFYNISGAEGRQPPFYTTLNANLNLTLFDVVSAPFSFSYSPNARDFSLPFQQRQPFNQLGISPSYKGITAHLGFRSINFSEYSYSGTNFLGVGAEIDLKDSKWKYAFFFGRLVKAIEDTTNLSNANQQVIAGYDRFGTAIRLKYDEGKGNSTQLVVFRAWDNAASLNIPENFVDSPKDNLIFSINSTRKLTSKLSYNIEYALSLLTRDTEASEESNLSGFSFLNNIPLFTFRSTSSANSAFKSKLTYNLKVIQLGVGYRRISPEYESLGIPFINNDIEDITGSVAWRMFANKVSISTSGGVQRNNLDGAKNAVNRRLIASINTTYSISKKLTANANVSNFNTSVTRTRIEGLDSLDFFQVARNVTLGTNYKLIANQNTVQSIGATGNFQGVTGLDENNSTVYVANLNYSMSFPKIGFTSAVAFNYNVNSFQGLDNPGLGTTLTLSKTLFKKELRTNLSVSQLSFVNGGTIVDRTLNIRPSLSYTFNKKHQFSFNYNLIQKENNPNNINFTESRAVIQYGYNFSSKK